MNKPLSIRQAVFMYLFISVAPVLRQIPADLARESGRSGYLSTVWAVLPLLLITWTVVLLIKSYPGLNIYEIAVQLAGKIFAKVIMILYLIWALLYLSVKLNAYALSIQFTLMPKTSSGFFVSVMLILIFYAFIKTTKTVFRFSEFTLGPVLFIIGLLIVCAFDKFRTDYLFPVPVTMVNLASTVKASIYVITIGGNVVLTMFFADRFGISITKDQLRKLWSGVLIFTVLCFFVTLFTFSVTGAALAANLPFPFYITVKSISFFNIFERFEVLVTLICILSDYVSVCIMFFIVTRIIMWLFGLENENKGFLFVPVAVIVYYLTFYVSKTQFEYDFFYRHVIVIINLIFLFVIPLLLSLICLFKRKYIRKQY